jgi:transcriptional regulator with XRE-family HTH domain
MNSNYFSSVLQQLIKESGYTQQGLAKAMGLKQSTICGWLTGTRNANYESLEALSKYFGVPVDCFFDNGIIDNQKTVEAVQRCS